MWDIGKASRRPRRFARATEGGFPRLSGGIPLGSRCPASPRHALRAEILGKPSLWVITKDLWYKAAQAAKPLRFRAFPALAAVSGFGCYLIVLFTLLGCTWGRNPA